MILAAEVFGPNANNGVVKLLPITWDAITTLLTCLIAGVGFYINLSIQKAAETSENRKKHEEDIAAKIRQDREKLELLSQTRSQLLPYADRFMTHTAQAITLGGVIN